MYTQIVDSADELKQSHGKCFTFKGHCSYYHYICDGFNDRGWGCGYRTLQTICSWIVNCKKRSGSSSIKPVPTIIEIQSTLVALEDKPKSFAGSREWIGSFEVCLLIDHLYGVPCKIIHLESGSKIRTIINDLEKHFENFGCPIMMGGNVDASSKGIFAIHKTEDDDIFFLVVDPHYVGKEVPLKELVDEKWIHWTNSKDFLGSSFYNLCLPQINYN